MRTKVVSIRLLPEQAERLDRLARRLGRTPSETAALLVEESVRETEFGYIEFRPTPAGGRQACLKGHSLAVWEVIATARGFALSTTETAQHLDLPPPLIEACLSYYNAFPAEVDAAIADNESWTHERLKRLLPNLELLEVPLQEEGAREAA